MAGITQIGAGNMGRGFTRFRDNPVVTTRTRHRTGKFIVIHLHRRHPSYLVMASVAIIAAYNMRYPLPFHWAIVVARHAGSQYLTVINRNLRTPDFGRMARFTFTQTGNVTGCFPRGPDPVMAKVATASEHVVVGRRRRPRRG